jgi:SnoaL-like protein
MHSLSLNGYQIREQGVVLTMTLEELGEEVAALQRRVDVSDSVLTIQAMKARYGELIDQRFVAGSVVDDATLAKVTDAVARTFTLDARWDGGPGLGVSVGRAAIAQRLRETTFSFARHFFMNPRIGIDGDSATARWHLLSPCRRGDTSYWMCGIEDDEYVRADGEWLQRSMKLTTVFFSPADDAWSKIFV